jgi:hypothetical protein
MTSPLLKTTMALADALLAAFGYGKAAGKPISPDIG